jgi:hypothetical protein
LALLFGCGDSGPKLYPVKGIVSRGGKPVANATVWFHPEQTDGRAAYGLLQTDGSFQLTTFKTNDGAMAGQYRVLVVPNKLTSAGPLVNPGNDTSKNDPLIEFADPARTKLRATVPSSSDIRLDLTSP